MARDEYEQFKLPWRQIDSHVVNRDGINGAIAFNVGSDVAKFIAEAVNSYERYKKWAEHLSAAPSSESHDEAMDLFILGERMKPFIDAWKVKVAELEDEIFRLENRFPTDAEFSNLQEDYEGLALENAELVERLNEALND